MISLYYPYALFLLAIPVIATLVFLFFRRKKAGSKFLLSGPDEILLQEAKRLTLTYRVLYGVLFAGICLLVYCIARPFEPRTVIEKSGEGIDIVIVLDVSESMDADDFEPSRIDVAKSVIRDFIKRRDQDRIGIVIFSGDAVTKAPLTRDYDFLLNQVEDIRLREMKQGTAIGMGLATGISRLRPSQSKSKIIVLLTDGDSNVGAINPVTASKLARQEKIKIYTIGIGKSNRVVVPIYSYDLFGRKTQLIAQVPSYLNPELLKEIASLTGGKAYMARDPGMLSRMLMEIDTLERSKIKITKREERLELFFWPALIATILCFAGYLLLDTRFKRLQYA